MGYRPTNKPISKYFLHFISFSGTYYVRVPITLCDEHRTMRFLLDHYANFEPFDEDNKTSLAQNPSDSINQCLTNSWSSPFLSFWRLSSLIRRVARDLGICITADDKPLPRDQRPARMISSWLSPFQRDHKNRPERSINQSVN